MCPVLSKPGTPDSRNHALFTPKLEFLSIDGLFHFFVKFLVPVHGFEGTGYMVSSWGRRCMVSRVCGTWFREYKVHSFEGTGTGT